MAVKTATQKIISGNPTKRNTGTIMQAGNNTYRNRTGSLQWNPLPLMTNNLNPDFLQGLIIPCNGNGVGFILAGTPVTLVTNIQQSSTTGYCMITKTSHGLLVGQAIQVQGTNVNGYNVIHRVTSVLSSSTVQTDIRYSADTSTPGSYYPINGNFAKLVKRAYVGMLISTQLAGVTNNSLLFTAAFMTSSYNESRGTYGTAIATFDYFTGVKTTGATWGVLNKFHDIAAGNENLTREPQPTRAIPGRLAFMSGGLIPTESSYKPKTQ